ncbi:MAG: diacylglycerol kinase [Candidatus Omnitrophica bacterium]|nr:diacylglycerol kinase [Candidatus Omnitrophota bacterium]
MHRMIESFNHAIEGFIYVLRTQRNMRVHFLLGVLIFIVGIILDFTRIELICLGSLVTLVLFAEMLNTAIEYTVDLISDAFHPLARVIKDISAGAVLLTALSAAIFGYLLFARHFEFSFIGGLSRIKNSPLHISIIAFIIVLSLTIIGKILFQKGTPMRGGMPSGHAALAFSVWTVVIFSTSNPLIIILTFIMAIVIARSRLSQRVHGVWEIVAGSLLGFFTTLLIFQFLR